MTRLLPLLLALALFSSGCASTMNGLFTQKPYGGIVLDGKAIGKGCVPDKGEDVFLGVGAVVDMPLSLVGDTLTVPFILYSNSLKPKMNNDGPEKK